MLSFEQLGIKNVERCQSSYGHDVTDRTDAEWLICIMSKVGEAAELLKKTRAGETVSPGDLVAVLGDITIYTDLMCSSLGCSLGEVVHKRFNEVSVQRGSYVGIDTESLLDVEAPEATPETPADPPAPDNVDSP